jgi:hypothetical protein
MVSIQAPANFCFELLKIVLALKKSLIHFCFKASVKAEKQLIQPEQKDPQHKGQILEFLGQKGLEQLLNSKNHHHCKHKGKELHLTPRLSMKDP